MAITITATGPLFGDTRSVVDREVRAVLMETGQLGARLLTERTPAGVSSAGGGLRGSTFTELRGTPGRREQRIGQSKFYAEIVELGRRAGKRPPVAALMRYVQLKLGKRGVEIERVAFLVARKIGARGYHGAQQFARTARQLEPLARQRLTVDLPARIARALGGA